MESKATTEAAPRTERNIEIPQSVKEELLKLITTRVKEDQILNIYLWGSRFWGTHTEASDWDFVTIVKNYVQPKKDSTVIGSIVDVSVYDVRYFANLITEHVPWALQLIWWPDYATLQKKLDLKFRCYRLRLRHALLINSQVNGQQLKSMYLSNDVMPAVKRAYHVLQMVELMKQIAIYGKIVDYFAATEYLQRFKEVSGDWTTFHEYWKKTYYQAVDVEFLNVVDAYMKFEAENKDTAPVAKTTAYIRKYGLQALDTDLAIFVRRSEKFPNLVHLHHEREYTPMNSFIGAECNGVILDESKDWSIVSLPYIQFYSESNFSGLVAEIDWNSQLQVTEQLDGWKATLYRYNDEWHVSTELSPDGSEILEDYNGEKVQFKDLFWRLFKSKGYELPDPKDNCNYMFEMISMNNRDIVWYAEDNLTLHGVRKLEGEFKEIEAKPVAEKYKWQFVREIHLPKVSKDTINAALLTEKNCCGYIIRDQSFARIIFRHPLVKGLLKVKFGQLVSKQRLEIFKLLCGFSDQETLMDYPYPETKEMFDYANQKYVDLCKKVNQHYKNLKDLSDMKAFSTEATKLGELKHFLFAMRNMKSDDAGELFRKQVSANVYKFLQLVVNHWMHEHPQDEEEEKFCFK
jgi:predicted nucleotidyltransferase